MPTLVTEDGVLVGYAAPLGLAVGGVDLVELRPDCAGWGRIRWGRGERGEGRGERGEGRGERGGERAARSACTRGDREAR